MTELTSKPRAAASGRAWLQAIVEGELAGVDGYIIDLRNNPGGVFEEAIAMSSYFLDGDGAAIVETVRVNDAASRRNVIDNVWAVGSLPGGAFPRHAWGLTSRPVVLLTNHGTASASEVMAGALQVPSLRQPHGLVALCYVGCAMCRHTERSARARAAACRTTAAARWWASRRSARAWCSTSSAWRTAPASSSPWPSTSRRTCTTWRSTAASAPTSSATTRRAACCRRTRRTMHASSRACATCARTLAAPRASCRRCGDARRRLRSCVLWWCKQLVRGCCGRASFWVRKARLLWLYLLEDAACAWRSDEAGRERQDRVYKW